MIRSILCTIGIFMVTCELLIQNEQTLKKGRLLVTLPVQLKSWSLSLELKPTGTLIGWSNIIHFTKDDNVANYGDRTPGIWFNTGSTRLHICSGINENVNKCYDSQPLTMNSYTKITITQEYQYGSSTKVYLYTIQVNKKVVYSIENNNPRQYKNVNVYTSDIWYQEADAKIRNMQYKNLMEKIICEHAGSKRISCPHQYYINIVYALYGRRVEEIGTCSKINPLDSCKAETSLSKSREICGEFQNSCSLQATNNWYGDPCKGLRKYLHVRYECIPDIGRFITSPSISGDKDILTGSKVKIIGCELESQQLTKQPQGLYTSAWSKDSETLTALNTKFFHVEKNIYGIPGHNISSVSFKDEGQYQCVLYEKSYPVAYSTILELQLDELVRTKYQVSVNLTSSHGNFTAEEAIKEVNSSIANTAVTKDVRYVSKRYGNIVTVQLFVYSLKANDTSQKNLYFSNQQLLTISPFSSYDAKFINFDFCRSKTIGDVEYKGIYYYAVAAVGDKITKECQYGGAVVSGAKSSPFFTTSCKSDLLQGAYWSPLDINNCSVKSRTAALERLNSSTVCTSQQESSTKNCVSPYDLSEQMKNAVTKKDEELSNKDVKLISNLLVNIGNGMNGLSANQTKSVVKNVVDVVEEIAELQHKPTMEKHKANAESSMQEIPRSLEYVAEKVANNLDVNNTISVSNKNIGLFIGKIENTNNNLTITSKKNSHGSLECFVSSNTDNSSSNIIDNNNSNKEDALAVMLMPASLFKNLSSISLYSISYSNGYFFKRNSDNDVVQRVDSSVLSVTITNKKLDNLTTPIAIRFKKKVLNNQTCSYWNEYKRRWDTQGVRTVGSKNEETNITYCETIHLTNFALIFDVSQTKANPLALQIITWIGCGISLAGLTIAVLSFLIFRRLRRKLVPKLLVCLSVSLMLLLITFIVGGVQGSPKSREDNTESRVTTRCQIVAGLLHYFILNTFMWMLIQAFNLYRSFIKIFNSSNNDTRFVLLSFLFCSGVPAVIVLVCVFVTKGEAYGHDNICVVYGNAFYFGVLLPTTLVLLTNIVILAFVIRSISKSSTAAKKAIQTADKTSQYLRHSKIILACSVLLGLTWLFGVFAVGVLTEVFQYLFCIFNSLQGFFIFVFFILTNDDVLREWRILFGMETFLNSSNSGSKGKSGNVSTSRSRNNTSQLQETKQNSKQLNAEEEDEIHENCLIKCTSCCRCIHKRCFKPNSSSQQQREIRTTIKQEQTFVMLETSNDKDKKTTTKTTTSTTQTTKTKQKHYESSITASATKHNF